MSELYGMLFHGLIVALSVICLVQACQIDNLKDRVTWLEYPGRQEAKEDEK